MTFSVLVTVLAKKTFSYIRRVPLFVRFMTVKGKYNPAPFLHKGMQFLPSFWGFQNEQKILMSIAARLCTEEVPCSNNPRVCAMAATTEKELQHSEETSVNDRKVKESGQGTQYSSYGQL
ncbi:hypothetical protein AVEN_239141-1 [Araneus ventricosus]|uniref:Uncharacterized protein n=1 Tax=Araneus ventricosus TaxID=182803 RepID=A0A4Y2H6X7_ARAVE|nr:hypothetical protein AVEN_239141-1 [Araneus ventricosus]